MCHKEKYAAIGGDAAGPLNNQPAFWSQESHDLREPIKEKKGVLSGFGGKKFGGFERVDCIGEWP